MRNASVFVGLLIGLSVAAAWATATAGEQFPYTGYINSADVYVRSGPGRDYYPTEKLQPGAPVEVYRHEPGGWYAIRPTEKSFSWVSSRYVKALPEGLAEVADERVAARVGSLLSNVRDVVQVRLKRGEVVEIVDEHNAGGQTWYKIAPPAGEFRWVAGRFVDRKPPNDGVSDPRRRDYRSRTSADDQRDDTPHIASEGRKRNGPRIATMAREDEGHEAADRDGTSRDFADREASVGPEDERVAIAAEDVDRDGTDDRSDVRRASWREPTDAERSDSRESDKDRGVRPAFHWGDDRESSSESNALPRGERSAETDATEPRKHTLPASAFQEKLDRLDNQISQMVVEEPTVWQFDELAAELTAMFESAGTAIERGHVRRVLSKVARFRDIQARYLEVNQVQADTDRRNGQIEAKRLEQAEIAPASGSQSEDGQPGILQAASETQTTQAIDSNFDGFGVLRPVVSRRRGAPPYALVDDRGDVRWFVSPAPGLNLQSMLGQRVGVVGTRGFMPEYGRPHVMARRVRVLEASPKQLIRR